MAFTITPALPAGPTSTPVFTTTTRGDTARWRAGLAINVYPPTTYHGSYDVYIGGRFAVGWRTLDQATTYAEIW